MGYFNFASNKGMFLETFINKTINFYIQQKICWIRKQNLFVKPKSIKSNEVLGKLNYKNDVDYYGIYKGLFICFEAKQTMQNKFLLSNIKEHQWEFLKNINNFGGISFLLVCFVNDNNFFAISYKNLAILKSLKIKSLTSEMLKIYAYKLEIKLPGIIDILSFLENEIINHKFNVK